MPYIKMDKRKLYDDDIEKIVNTLTKQPLMEVDGDLNYVVTSMFKKFYAPRYFNYNRAIGVLEAIKQEFYRRVVATYEDIKIKENGDV